MQYKEITSRQNEIIKDVAKLTDKKQRHSQGRYLVEGINLGFEALVFNHDKLDMVIVSEQFLNSKKYVERKFESYFSKKGINEVYVLADNVFEKISQDATPEGLILIYKMPPKHGFNENYQKHSANDIMQSIEIPDVIVLENVNNPGNLGAVLRVAQSAGISRIYISTNSVDMYSPKVIKSSMGAFFKVNIIVDSIENIVQTLADEGYWIYGTSMIRGNCLYDCDFVHKKVKDKDGNEDNVEVKNAIVFGNEALGISSNAVAKVNENVYIPMNDKTESLNLATATGIIAYEILRQRRFNK